MATVRVDSALKSEEANGAITNSNAIETAASNEANATSQSQAPQSAKSLPSSDRKEDGGDDEAFDPLQTLEFNLSPEVEAKLREVIPHPSVRQTEDGYTNHGGRRSPRCE